MFTLFVDMPVAAQRQVFVSRRAAETVVTPQLPLIDKVVDVAVRAATSSMLRPVQGGAADTEEVS